jgi:hypothetical protein
MPLATLTFPKVEVTLDVPADFAAYVTLEDLRVMAEGILSVQHIGLGIDTICRLRKDEKTHQWTHAMVSVDEDDAPDVRIEDDGFTHAEREIAAIDTGTLTLSAEYRRLGHDLEAMTISGPCAPEEATLRLRGIIAHLENLWKNSTP